MCDRLAIELPIISAGTGPIAWPASSPRSNVGGLGGLGVLGCTSISPDEIRAVIRRTRELTDQPSACLLGMASMNVLLPSRSHLNRPEPPTGTFESGGRILGRVACPPWQPDAPGPPPISEPVAGEFGQRWQANGPHGPRKGEHAEWRRSN